MLNTPLLFVSALFVFLFFYVGFLVRDEFQEPGAVVENRVLFVTGDMLLGEGLAHILNRQSDLTLYTVRGGNVETLLHQMNLFQPTTIIITDQASQAVVGQLLQRLHHASYMRLICVSAEDDVVQVYEKNQFTIHHVDDFASMVSRRAYPQPMFVQDLETALRMPEFEKTAVSK